MPVLRTRRDRHRGAQSNRCGGLFRCAEGRNGNPWGPYVPTSGNPQSADSPRSIPSRRLRRAAACTLKDYILREDKHMADSTTHRVPRILSLDGGGVRGLSSLLILRDIMEDIERRTEADETPKPCEYFDLIGGTSTGGLIAIMLGLLGMVTSINSSKLM